MHLEFLKNIKFKGGKQETFRYCSHVFVYILYGSYGLGNSDQLSYVSVHLVGTCLVGLHLVGALLASHSAHLTFLKTIILDHA